MTTRRPRSCAAWRNSLEVIQRAVARMHARIVGDVVAVVPQRRREERQQPEAGDAQVLEVVELLDQARKSPMPSALPSENDLTWQLVDDGVLVPERIVRGARSSHAFAFWSGASGQAITKAWWHPAAV